MAVSRLFDWCAPAPNGRWYPARWARIFLGPACPPARMAVKREFRSTACEQPENCALTWILVCAAAVFLRSIHPDAELRRRRNEGLGPEGGLASGEGLACLTSLRNLNLR